MDGTAVLALAALLAAAATLAFVLRRPGAAEPAADLREAVAAQLAAAQQGMQGSVSLVARSVDELRAELQRSLGTTEQQLVTQTGSTQQALADVARQLGALGEQSARIGELAKDIGSLQDLLRGPKTRGGFGELMLERLLADCLPLSAYETQYTYRDGSRVDAVVRFTSRLVPIDAKFPNESYAALAAAREDGDAVSRYVSPQDGTIDYAFLYVPSESVYYELIREDPDTDVDIRAYAAERHVIPASPNTLLAYLQVVALAVRGLAMQERTRELQQGVAQVRRQFDRFVELHDQLGRHLQNATNKFDETERALARASGAIEALAQAPLAAGGEQVPLPMHVEE